MKLAIAAVLLVLALSGCTRPDVTQRVLSEQGFTNIQTTGYGFLKCSEDDVFATRFTAKSSNDQQVSGTVCSGLLKGSTVRFD